MLPSYMVDAVINYFEKGWTPGDFLRSVLENDLVGTFAYADDTNKLYVHKYVQWLWWHAPGRSSGAWGSVEAVEEWIREAAKEATAHKNFARENH